MLTLRPEKDYELMQVVLRKEVEQNRTKTVQRNTALASDMEAEAVLRFNGSRYLVPPVPYKLGNVLQDMMLRLQEYGATASPDMEDEDDMDRMVQDGIALFPRLCYPESLIRRLLRPFLPNPFSNISVAEFGDLLGFFWGCRMRSSVQFPSSGTTARAEARPVPR